MRPDAPGARDTPRALAAESAGGERLAAQLAFVRALDGLKSVARRTRLMDGSRRENSAEHSWHLAAMAVVLAEYAPPGADVARAVRMLLVHDVVEIEAGDTFAFAALADPAVAAAQAAAEARAAGRLFGLLPADQAAELRALWEEFEAACAALGGTPNDALTGAPAGSPTARFAVALDRLQPLLQNAGQPAATAGGTWREAGVALDVALRRMAPVRAGAPALWPFVERTFADAVAAGYIAAS